MVIVLLPEPEDKRVLDAALVLSKEKSITPILIGNVKLRGPYAKLGQIHPVPDDAMVAKLCAIRKEKGMRPDEARLLLAEPIYYATMLLVMGKADGLVSGAMHPTAHTLRPALQIIKTHRKAGIASSAFLLRKGKQRLLFADCAMNIAPDAKALAQIAVDSAATARFLGITPRIAMLSFSTKGSAKHEEVDNVTRALALARRALPASVLIDGELQFDAALVPSVARLKAKDSAVAGKANVFIFPDLNSGNIGYKIAQRLGGYEAVGPIVQGLKKPVNDLSRGCSVSEIVDLVRITALQARAGK